MHSVTGIEMSAITNAIAPTRIAFVGARTVMRFSFEAVTLASLSRTLPLSLAVPLGVSGGRTTGALTDPFGTMSILKLRISLASIMPRQPHTPGLAHTMPLSLSVPNDVSGSLATGALSDPQSTASILKPRISPSSIMPRQSHTFRLTYNDVAAALRYVGVTVGGHSSLRHTAMVALLKAKMAVSTVRAHKVSAPFILAPLKYASGGVAPGALTGHSVKAPSRTDATFMSSLLSARSLFGIVISRIARAFTPRGVSVWAPGPVSKASLLLIGSAFAVCAYLRHEVVAHLAINVPCVKHAMMWSCNSVHSVASHRCSLRGTPRSTGFCPESQELAR